MGRKSLFSVGQILESKLSQYQLLEKLGEGGFGTTFKAHQHSANVDVTVKILHWDKVADWKAVELFEREGEVLKGLNHPHIPAYIDSFPIKEGSEADGYALVQSYVEGLSLAQLMASERRLQPEEMMLWFSQILDVCEYLHRQHPAVIHRDIKPDNIILRPDGSAALIDFGTVQAAMISTNSISSTAAGTFGYAPMEQFLQRAVPQSDLYGLAITFVAISCKQDPKDLPFVGNRLDVHKALKGTVIDANVVALLEEMSDPDPDKRPVSASAARKTLNTALDAPVHEPYSRSRIRRDARKGKALPPARSMIASFENCHVYEEGECFELSWKWYTPKFLFFVFFFVLWDSFLFIWYTNLTQNTPWFFSVFPMIHVAVGVVGTYYTIAGFWNQTRISVTPDQLSVIHEPMPWFGQNTFDIEGIEQLFCKEKIQQGEKTTTITYEVHLLVDGRQHKLVSGLNTPEQALFIERQIEDYLGIEDTHVAGQLTA